MHLVAIAHLIEKNDRYELSITIVPNNQVGQAGQQKRLVICSVSNLSKGCQFSILVKLKLQRQQLHLEHLAI